MSGKKSGDEVIGERALVIGGKGLALILASRRLGSFCNSEYTRFSGITQRRRQTVEAQRRSDTYIIVYYSGNVVKRKSGPGATHLVVEPVIIASLGAVVVGRDHLAGGIVAIGDGADCGAQGVFPELLRLAAELVEDVLDDFAVDALAGNRHQRPRDSSPHA